MKINGIIVFVNFLRSHFIPTTNISENANVNKTIIFLGRGVILNKVTTKMSNQADANKRQAWSGLIISLNYSLFKNTDSSLDLVMNRSHVVFLVEGNS